jgi:hypothetical protein
MNEEDKKRFARYLPGYIEPPEVVPSMDDDTKPETKLNSEKVKDTLGFVEKINVNQDDLINQVLKEMAIIK